MTLSNLPPLVTVFGGSGFVGRHVVRALAKRGYRIRVAVRRPDLAFFLQPLGNVGQISFVQANLRYRASVDKAVQVHGGLGYLRTTPVERFYRDARLYRLYEGTSEVQRVIIGGALLREAGMPRG